MIVFYSKAACKESKQTKKSKSYQSMNYRTETKKKQVDKGVKGQERLHVYNTTTRCRAQSG